MVFREDLEGGSLPRAAIDAKVAEYRANLVAESDSVAMEANRKAALARCVAHADPPSRSTGYEDHPVPCFRHPFPRFNAHAVVAICC